MRSRLQHLPQVALAPHARLRRCSLPSRPTGRLEPLPDLLDGQPQEGRPASPQLCESVPRLCCEGRGGSAEAGWDGESLCVRGGEKGAARERGAGQGAQPCLPVYLFWRLFRRLSPRPDPDCRPSSPASSKTGRRPTRSSSSPMTKNTSAGPPWVWPQRRALRRRQLALPSTSDWAMPSRGRRSAGAPGRLARSWLRAMGACEPVVWCAGSRPCDYYPLCTSGSCARRREGSEAAFSNSVSSLSCLVYESSTPPRLSRPQPTPP